MRRWLIMAATALAVVLLVVWIARNTYWEEVTVPLPPRGEALSNPFYRVQRFLTELGIENEWRRTLGELPEHDAVLVLTHWNWDLIESRRREIERWVEAGGRLVLDDTLVSKEQEDEDGFSFEAKHYSLLAFSDWSGLSIELPPPASEDGVTDEFLARDLRRPDHCWEVELVAGESFTNSQRERYDLCGLRRGTIVSTRPLDWAVANKDGHIKAVRVRIGDGHLIFLYGDLFHRRHLILERDHGAFFVDAAQLSRSDRVVFVADDEHPSLLRLIWMYGAPVVLLALAFIALSLWRNSVRFGPPIASPERARRSLAEQIRGTGEFIARFDGGRALHAAMVRAMHDAARARLPNYDTMPADERLAAVARISGIDADTLVQTARFAGKRSRHELKEAVALLDRARKALLTRTGATHRAESLGAS